MAKSNGSILRTLALALVGAFIAIAVVTLAPQFAQNASSASSQTKTQGSAAQESEAQGSETESGSDEAQKSAAGEAFTADHDLRHAEIVVKDYGTIALELDATVAPVSVENFCRLASEGFYENTTFHRIISGFMIQGGADLTGEQPTITGEFAQNGYENPISHVRGVISMARANDFDSASTQFFIVHEDSLYLDGAYAAFGRVTDGMDVVDTIAENTPVQDDNGTVAEADQPIIESVSLTD